MFGALGSLLTQLGVSSAPSFLRPMALVVFATLAFGVQAQPGALSVTPVGGLGGTVNVQGGAQTLQGLLEGRSYIPKSGGGVTVREPFSTTGPDGKKLDLNFNRELTRGAIGLGAGLLLRSPLAAAAAVALWDAMREQGVEPDANGSPQVNMGEQGTVTKKYWLFAGGCETPMLSAAAAASACGGRTIAASPNSYYINSPTCNLTECSWSIQNFAKDCAVGCPYYKTGITVVQVQIRSETKSFCGDSTSTLIITGANPCQSDNRVAATPAQIDAAAGAAATGASDTRIRAIIPAILDNGGKIDAQPTPVVSGPSSVPGPSRETTGPNGDTTISTSNWNITYGGNSFKWDYNTTTIAPGGGVTTTKDETPPEDPCRANPGRVGCTELGQADGDDKPKKASKTIDFDPVNVPGGGSCPPDMSFSVSGGSYVITTRHLCDATVNYAKPFILLASALAAALIFIGGLKS